MKSRLIASLAVLTLALSGAFTVSALAQTTDETPAPSDQPSAPMEMGQPGPNPQSPDMQSNEAQPSYDQNDAQPSEAQPGGPSGEAPAKTDQGVARVSLIHGDVSTQRGDSGDWSAATLNQPVMTGDKVSTGDNARTELQLDFANILRLGPNSKANIANLTQETDSDPVGPGHRELSRFRKTAKPSLRSILPTCRSIPRIMMASSAWKCRPDGDTIVIVRQGEAQIATPQGSTEVQAGDMATIRGDADSAQYKISSSSGSRRLGSMEQRSRSHDPQRQFVASHQPLLHRNAGSRRLRSAGRTFLTTAMSGFRTNPTVGFRIATATGPTSPTTAGLGSATSLGAGRRITTAAGSRTATRGPGGPVRSTVAVSTVRSGRPRTSRSGAGAAASASALASAAGAASAGSRSGLATTSIRGGVDIAAASAWSNVNSIHVNNRYGGFAPLHGGTRFSNVANIHDNHIGRALSTVNAGHFGAGRVTAMAATPSADQRSAHDGGQFARGSFARQFVGQRTRGSTVHGAQWRFRALLRIYAQQRRPSSVVPAADRKSAADDAAEPRGRDSRWRPRECRRLCGIPRHDGEQQFAAAQRGYALQSADEQLSQSRRGQSDVVVLNAKRKPWRISSIHSAEQQ